MAGNTILSFDFQVFPWVGGQAKDVAGIRASLSQLASHFARPLIRIERSIWILFDFDHVGLVGICCENIDEPMDLTTLTSKEINWMINASVLPVYVGAGVDQAEFQRVLGHFFRDVFLIEFY